MKMKRFYEDYYVDEYEVNYLSITNSRCNYRQYRECSTYESAYFYAEESDEYYCNIRVERLA